MPRINHDRTKLIFDGVFRPLILEQTPQLDSLREPFYTLRQRVRHHSRPARFDASLAGPSFQQQTQRSNQPTTK
jgi:hypothetical protein